MKKSLLASARTKALARNIETSSAIEGIHVKRDAVTGCFVAQQKDVKTPLKPAKTSR